MNYWLLKGIRACEMPCSCWASMRRTRAEMPCSGYGDLHPKMEKRVRDLRRRGRAFCRKGTVVGGGFLLMNARRRKRTVKEKK